MSSVDVWTLLMRSVFESHNNTSSRQGHSVWALVQCAICPSRFLAECHKRRLNQDSIVLLHFVLYFGGSTRRS